MTIRVSAFVARLGFAAGFTVAGVAVAANLAAAQVSQRVALGDRQDRAVPAVATSAPATFDLSLVDVPLGLALDEIARRADVQIAYSRSLLPLQRRVTVQGRALTLEAALIQALRGTEFTMLRSPGGQISLGRTDAKAAAAVTQGSVQGKVTNAKNRQPIVGATIFVDDAAKGVLTGEDGSFRLTIPTGEHTVTVRAVGFVKQMRKISVTEAQGTVLEFTLEPSASVLNEVVVTGTVVATERKAIPTPITVITAEELEKRNITRVEQLFRGEVPGVIALDKASQTYADGNRYGDPQFGAMQTSSIYTRGASGFAGNGYGSATPLKTYIDGVELLDASYLGTIDPRSIERIEIITGPQAATIYGSGAMGGVMQIFTKKGSASRAPEFTLNLRYGILQNNLSDGLTPTHSHNLAVAGGSGADFSYSGNFSYGYTGEWRPGLFSRTYGASGGITHTRGPITVGGSVSTSSGSNGTKVAILQVLPSERKKTGDWWFGTPTSFYDSQRISTSSAQTISVNVDGRISSSWQHHLTVGKSQNRFDITPVGPRFFSPQDTLYSTGNSSGQRNTANYNTTVVTPRLGPIGSTMTIGLTGSWGDQIQSTGCIASTTSTTYVSCSWGFPLRISKTLNSDSWGGFGSWQVGMFDRLYFTLGVRGERNPAYGREHKIDWTPTNGLTYTVETGPVTVKLLGSYGRATRPPAPSMRLAQVENCGTCTPTSWVSQLSAPELRPEYASGPQGGVELYFGNIGSLTVNRYSQRVNDLIQNVIADSLPIVYSWGTSNSYIYQYQNVASVKQYGWEGTGTVTLGPLSLKGTYSWNESRVASINITGSDATAYYPGMSFQSLPTHTGNLIASYALGGTSVTLTTNFVGGAMQESITNIMYWESEYSRIKTYLDRITKWDYLGLRWLKPGYSKSDLAMTQRLAPWASAMLNVTNLGNSFGSDVSALDPALGRQTQIGVSIRYPRGK